MSFQLKTEDAYCWLRSPEGAVSMIPREFAAEPRGDLSFFAPDFALSSSTPWLVGEAGEAGEAVFDGVPLPPLLRRAEPASAEFARTFEEIQRHIGAAHFEKVVPIVDEALEFERPLSANHFAAVIQESRPYQYNYGFTFQDEGMVGVTPEVLFRVQDDRLKTMALAGTGKADGPSLMDNKKERFEHQLVIDHIERELKSFATPEIGRTEERVYGVLKHLYTPITAKLSRPPEFMKLVVALHPTAALGGWPRRPAIEWLEAQPFHASRRRFGAPFGFTRGAEMLCVVAIRGLQWRGRNAKIFSGAGIVRQSEALAEWNELALNRRATRKLLGLQF